MQEYENFNFRRSDCQRSFRIKEMVLGNKYYRPQTNGEPRSATESTLYVWKGKSLERGVEPANSFVVDSTETGDSMDGCIMNMRTVLSHL